MEKFVVNGGKPLFGEVNISGAKNAAVAIIPAVILCDEPCQIENIPNISDVTLISKILQQMGAKVKRINRSTLYIDPTHIHSSSATTDLVRGMRASYYLLGALLGKYGKA
ncbi:MAG: UDP-N-acetylglucosamine 1-carboxyvinyltransferase, partial [Ruminococcus sp.]|nr:UDP-N-acetylglucosamine 1-carboxyvinyltransferase [Ruminococcus sp.]